MSKRVAHFDGKRLWIWCPGCADLLKDAGLHAIPVAPVGAEFGPTWTWDGTLDAPDLSPSIRTLLGEGRVCHSFLKAGQWEFLTDSTHSLAGQTVPMVPLPDWAPGH